MDTSYCTCLILRMMCRMPLADCELSAIPTTAELSPQTVVEVAGALPIDVSTLRYKVPRASAMDRA